MKEREHSGRKRPVRQKFRSLTAELTIIFLALWLLASTVVITALYESQTRMNERILASQEEQVQYYAALINTDLQRVQGLLQGMCIDSDVLSYVRSIDRAFDYQSYTAYRASYEKLQSYQSTSLYIDDVFLVLPGSNDYLTASHGVISLPADYQTQVEQCIREGKEITFLDDGRIVYLYKAAYDSVVGLEISVSYIGSLLNIISTGEFYCMLINSSTGELMADDDQNAEESSVYEAIAAQAGEKPEFIQTSCGEKYLYEYLELPDSAFQLILYANEGRVYSDLHALRQVWIFVTILIIAIPVIMVTVLRKLIAKPMKKLVSGMRSVEKQEWSYRLEEDGPSEFNYVFRQYNHMAARMETLIEEVYKKQLQYEQARRRQLQAQINPHFLYNSFYMGYRLAKDGDTDEVADLCMHLGDYFKYILRDPDSRIPLSQELDFVKSYLQLNQLRFEEKMNYSIESRLDITDLSIQPLMIQPLVENAIRHGVECVDDMCTVRVELYEEKDFFVCTVSDNSHRMTEETCDRLRRIICEPEIPESCFGLWNIEKRLESMGVDHGLVFDITQDGTTCVSIRIPMSVMQCERAQKERLDV